MSVPRSGLTASPLSVDGVLMAAGGSNLLSMTTSLDAIGEVKVLRDNYAAEYGNNGGAMINIVTKGGNYGWAYVMGTNTAGPQSATTPPGFTQIPPFYAYQTSSSSTLGRRNCL